MSDVIQQKVMVQPGGILEIHVPQYPPGTMAEVTITLPSRAPHTSHLSQLIGSGQGSFQTPQEVDQFIRSERDSWDS